MFFLRQALLLYALSLIHAASTLDLNSQCSEGGVICLHRGACEEHTLSTDTKLELCKCQIHFSGRDCSFANTDCTHYNCKHGSVCGINGCKCTNTTLYTGRDCGEVHCIVNGRVTSNYCKNGGICYNGTCVCPNSTRGEHCEKTACGEHMCSGGYCSLDRCECDVPCDIGCDQTSGICKLEPDAENLDSSLTTSTQVVVGAAVVVIVVIILPAMYAMYNVRLENRERNARIRSQMDFQRLTYTIQLEKQWQKKSQRAAKNRKAKNGEEIMSDETDEDSIYGGITLEVDSHVTAATDQTPANPVQLPPQTDKPAKKEPNKIEQHAKTDQRTKSKPQDKSKQKAKNEKQIRKTNQTKTRQAGKVVGENKPEATDISVGNTMGSTWPPKPSVQQIPNSSSSDENKKIKTPAKVSKTVEKVTKPLQKATQKSGNIAKAPEKLSKSPDKITKTSDVTTKTSEKRNNKSENTIATLEKSPQTPEQKTSNKNSQRKSKSSIKTNK